MSTSKIDAVRELAGRRGVIRPRDLAERGLPVHYLHRLWRAGELEQIERGLYRSPAAPLTEHHSLVEAVGRVPDGVICLLSAVSFHGLGTQCPEQVWMAIGRKDCPPTTRLPLRLVRFSPGRLRGGVRRHTIEGVSVPITTVSRTLCDLAAFRARVGLDVLEEAIDEAWASGRVTLEGLSRQARLARVGSVLQPHLTRLGLAR